MRKATKAIAYTYIQRTNQILTILSTRRSIDAYGVVGGSIIYHAQKCWITVSMGNRQTGQVSPLAFSTRAQVKQQAM